MSSRRPFLLPRPKSSAAWWSRRLQSSSAMGSLLRSEPKCTSDAFTTFSVPGSPKNKTGSLQGIYQPSWASQTVRVSQRIRYMLQDMLYELPKDTIIPWLLLVTVSQGRKQFGLPSFWYLVLACSDQGATPASGSIHNLLPKPLSVLGVPNYASLWSRN